MPLPYPQDLTQASLFLVILYAHAYLFLLLTPLLTPQYDSSRCVSRAVSHLLIKNKSTQCTLWTLATLLPYSNLHPDEQLFQTHQISKTWPYWRLQKNSSYFVIVVLYCRIVFLLQMALLFILIIQYFVYVVSLCFSLWITCIPLRTLYGTSRPLKYIRIWTSHCPITSSPVHITREHIQIIYFIGYHVLPIFQSDWGLPFGVTLPSFTDVPILYRPNPWKKQMRIDCKNSLEHFFWHWDFLVF